MVTEPPPITNFDVIHGSRYDIDVNEKVENTLLTSIDHYRVLYRHENDVTKQKSHMCDLKTAWLLNPHRSQNLT